MGVKWRKRRLAYRLLVLCLSAVLFIAGCSAGSTDNSSAANSGSSSRGGDGSVAYANSGVEPTMSAQAADAKDDGGTPGFVAEDADFAINRKLIYKARVTMEVDDYGAVQTEIRNLIQLSGGYLLEFSESKTEYERGGTFVIKVPSSGFMGFLNRLEEMSPDHYESRITGEDVTEEYVDLDSRLNALQVTEQRLLVFMEKASRADELVEFSRELSRVQQDIEAIKGRMRYLDQNVAYSTIEARIYERAEGSSRIKSADAPFGQRLSDTLVAVLNGISVVLQELIIFIIAAIPVVFVFGILASPFYLWYRHHSRRRQDRIGDMLTNAPVQHETSQLQDSEDKAIPQAEEDKQAARGSSESDESNSPDTDTDNKTEPNDPQDQKD